MCYVLFHSYYKISNIAFFMTHLFTLASLSYTHIRQANSTVGGPDQIISQEQDSFLGICAHFLFNSAKNELFLTLAISLLYPESTLSIQVGYKLNCLNTQKEVTRKQQLSPRGPLVSVYFCILSSHRFWNFSDNLWLLRDFRMPGFAFVGYVRMYKATVTCCFLWYMCT